MPIIVRPIATLVKCGGGVITRSPRVRDASVRACGLAPLLRALLAPRCAGIQSRPAVAAHAVEPHALRSDVAMEQRRDVRKHQWNRRRERVRSLPSRLPSADSLDQAAVKLDG